MMETAEHDVSIFMAFPKELRAKAHSTNLLALRNGEVKHPADVVGFFPDKASIRRPVGALSMEKNDKCAIQKRYMSLETLATMSESPLTRLAAAPALT